MTDPVPDSMTAVADAATLDALVERITGISTLPQIALRVMEAAQNPEATAADLKVLVESDPALSARVLRSVNSAANGLRMKITNVQQAISYLGFNQIRNLAITASVGEIFRVEEPTGPYRRMNLWRHMVSVGVCARLVASRLALPNFDDAFLAGLLHDIGIILEDQHAHDKFKNVIRNLQNDLTLAQIEQVFLGFDHTTLGERIAEKWQFPPGVRNVIRFHHGSKDYHGEHAELVQCVEIANVVCTVKDISSVGRKLVQAPQAAMAGLNLDMTDIKVLTEDLGTELASNECLFEL